MKQIILAISHCKDDPEKIIHDLMQKYMVQDVTEEYSRMSRNFVVNSAYVNEKGNLDIPWNPRG